MNKRQKQVQKSLLNNELAVMKALEKSYEEAIAEIDDVILELLARKDVQNIQSIIYQLKYQEHIKKELEELLEVLHENNYTTIDDYLNDCYANGQIGTLFDLQGQGIPLIIPLDQEQVISAITLNSKLKAPLYYELGYNVDALKLDITRELSRGIAQSLSYQEIARNLKNITGVDMNKTMRIARTEGHRVSQEATYNTQLKALERGAEIVKVWDSTLDGRTRDSHRSLDGEVREVHEKFSNGLLYPSDPNGSAGEVINCRCCLLQIARWDLEEGFTKMNGKTNEIQYFKNIEDYKEFTKEFWKVTK